MMHKQKAAALYRQIMADNTRMGNITLLEHHLRTAEAAGFKRGVEKAAEVASDEDDAFGMGAAIAASIRQLIQEQAPSASEKPPQA